MTKIKNTWTRKGKYEEEGANERKGKMKPKGERKRKEVGLGAKKGILNENERIGSSQHTNQM